MSSGFMIRPAEPTDLTTLRKFEQGVVESERAVCSSIRRDKTILYYDLEELLQDSEHESCLIVILEANDGAAIGCGLAWIRPNKGFYKEEKRGYIGLMYIEPNYRRQGLSKVILNSLVEWLRQKNISDIRLEVFADNKDAVVVYKKYGFEPMVTEMQLASGR